MTPADAATTAPSGGVKIVTIPGSISNAFLLLGQRPVLVDTGTDGDLPRIDAALRAHDVAWRDLALVIHTHGHTDHCGCTHEIADLTQAPIAIHEADAEMMASGEPTPLRPTGLGGRLLAPFLGQAHPGCEADLLLDAELSLDVFGVPGHIHFTPGHTAGSLSLLLESGDALCGDIIMGGPFNGVLLADWPMEFFFLDDPQENQRSIDRLLSEANLQRWHLGHGGPVRQDDVRRWLGGG